MRNMRKCLSSIVMLLAIAVASVLSFSATAMADDAPATTQQGWSQVSGRLRGWIVILQPANSTGRATYKVSGTATDLRKRSVSLHDRFVRVRPGQQGRVAYALPVSAFGPEADLALRVWRKDASGWVEVGNTTLTLRRGTRVGDTLVPGAVTPPVDPPVGFSGLMLENRTTSLRFSSIDFGRSTETARYTVTFAPTAGEPVGPTTSVDPGEDAKLASSALTGAGFGAGTYSAIVNWSDGSKSTVTWPAWAGPGTSMSLVLNDQTPRVIP